MARLKGDSSKYGPAKIFWSPEHSRYAVVYGQPLGAVHLNDMRMLNSTYLAADKIWLVDEGDLTILIDIATSATGYPPTVDLKPEPQSSISIGAASDAATAALKMFEVGGYSNAKKVYSILIKEFHPDYNQNPDAHDKAAEITKSWKMIKTALGW